MNITVGNKLKEIRISKKWSQEDAANNLQISQSLYNQIERGESTFWIKNVNTICQVFKVRPKELIRNTVEINNFEKFWNTEKLKAYEEIIKQQEIKIEALNEIIQKLNSHK